MTIDPEKELPSIINVYYLESSASKSGTDLEEADIEALSEEYMKSEQFLIDLNTNSQWGTWKTGSDGYPVHEYED